MKYHQRDIVEVSFLFPDGTFKPHPAIIVSNDQLQVAGGRGRYVLSCAHHVERLAQSTVFLSRRCDPFVLCLTIKKATKSTSKYQFPIKKFGRFNKKHYLCTHENPPSLFTMLKSAGHFIFLWHIIQRPTHRPPN